MNHLQAKGSDVLLRLDTPVQDRIVFKSGGQIYLPGIFEIEKWATCQAVVSSVGPNNSCGLKEGDVVAVDYRLISDYERRGDVVNYRRCINNLSSGEKVWRADDWMILGVKREGHWQAVGEWAIMSAMKNIGFKSELIIASELSEVVERGKARLLSGGDGIPGGSVVYFDDAYRAEYTFPGQESYIIFNSRYIVAYHD